LGPNEEPSEHGESARRAAGQGALQPLRRRAVAGATSLWVGPQAN